jgi:hypothetical protein
MTNLIELVMIVKNSGDILKNCLEINKKFIDHWTILDTGSIDNTCDIINDVLKDIPGKLHHGTFIDFSQARNESLNLSSQTCKFTILLDDSYIIHGGDKLRKLLAKTKKDAFKIKIGKFEHGFLNNDYNSIRIFRTIKKFRYIYRVHEILNIQNENSIQTINDKEIFLNDLTFEPHTDRSFKRYKNDIKLLLLDHEDDKFDPRTIYYLAKTYHCLVENKKSIEYYNKLKNVLSIIENKEQKNQFSFASVYDVACIEYFEDQDIESFKHKLLNITKLFNDRAEAFYKLAVIYKDQGLIQNCNQIISNILYFKKPNEIYTIIESDIYHYFIPYLYVETKLILKDYDNSITILKTLLSQYPYDQSLLNIKYNLCKNDISSIKLSNNKTLVIHTSHDFSNIYCWNPNEYDQRISGSEFMAMNLANEFYKLGFRVFIIGTFEDKETNRDYQGIYNNIEYIDYKYFSEFALKYEIDYLIISRFVKNLIYYNNIKNVYLWIHDVLPVMDNNSKCIQIHTEKFKGVIAVSEWQKENTAKTLNVPRNKIIVSRNAIDVSRFINKNINKIPFRFIYSSAPERGLSHLIDIIPSIKQKYPLTTLYIYVNLSKIDKELEDKIKLLDYVYLNNRLNQDEIAIEMLKSDIWLYPTDFQETYCITAVEAMAAKCLIATVDYAGLGNITAGKAILCKHPISSNKDELLKKLFYVIDNQTIKEHYINKAYDWAIQQTYDSLAKEWIKFF